jgi:hypothetical protein
MSMKFRAKIEGRLMAGECAACGHPKKECRCKSTLKKPLKGSVKYGFNRTAVPIRFAALMARVEESRRKRAAKDE